ncbi:hypothetical protein BU24DRAFT_382242 [Aaosphaeria arxii CBS 175.79]|uniref:Uncharacterized protein n=1 Tax=Aaosphaeria arxii CBS 175.79 TaxID=1450172 RepID=A0A6A5Y473_9PLEO|nr:uncharacterized protein BU24DRAFT_382242 [Aaosphaeria arxii CBS 175.79]KAF2020375.1 hypothetical protein BU24DRAFT_382242 [Aaosphaeria arxii CBS 175.79]
MDSMRSLNRSLPKTKSLSQASQPDVTQSFRAAALTVTNLYKSAMAEIDKSHAEGYQEALKDILALMDRENLGAREGEGSRIRNWVSERVDGSLPGNSNSDSEEEIMEEKEEKRVRSSSPALERNVSPEESRASESTHADIVHRSDSAPPPLPMEATTTDPESGLPTSMFQFSSPHVWPATPASESPNMDASRRPLATPRRTPRTNRSMQRAAAQNIFSLGNGAGQKRRMMQDFFNIDGLNDRREGGGGGGGGGSKRGRMS